MGCCVKMDEQDRFYDEKNPYVIYGGYDGRIVCDLQELIEIDKDIKKILDKSNKKCYNKAIK